MIERRKGKVELTIVLREDLGLIQSANGTGTKRKGRRGLKQLVESKNGVDVEFDKSEKPSHKLCIEQEGATCLARVARSGESAS